MTYKAICTTIVDTANHIELNKEQMEENQAAISRMLKKEMRLCECNTKEGLAKYIHKDDGLEKVTSINLSFEKCSFKAGERYGIIATIETTDELDEEDTVNLISYLEGQFSDGFGECLIQDSFPIVVNGKKTRGYIDIRYVYRIELAKENA